MSPKARIEKTGDRAAEWVRNDEALKCPGCGRKMAVIAQEGIDIVADCQPCRRRFVITGGQA